MENSADGRVSEPTSSNVKYRLLFRNFGSKIVKGTVFDNFDQAKLLCQRFHKCPGTILRQCAPSVREEFQMTLPYLKKNCLSQLQIVIELTLKVTNFDPKL